MLKELEFNKTIDDAEYKERIKCLEDELGICQRACREKNIPVMIMVEGYGASGKGYQISKLIHNLDPRGYQVFTEVKEPAEYNEHPHLWHFWDQTPARGRIAFFDTGWYRKPLIGSFEGRVGKKKRHEMVEQICRFEREHAEDGYVIIKLFYAIDKEEQWKRFKKRLKNKEKSWRVSKDDEWRNKEYDRYTDILEEVLAATNSDWAPWNIIEANDKQYATIRSYEIVIDALKAAIEKADNPKPCECEYEEYLCTQNILQNADLSLALGKKEYKEKLYKLQKRAKQLQVDLYRKGISMVLGFEGWDAGGKGGAIKRVTESMDARGYVVHPTSSPTAEEKAHHYLWRFWRAMPHTGYITIFDRTWYGRVMVERIEGFCRKDEWQRAYDEINEMEKELTDSGCIVLKFWMQIDKDEQAKRFTERQENPLKQWKITDEDWRNREKWDAYEVAVEEMLERTNTENAPWIVVEGNDKYYARVKVLESVVNAMEKKLAEK